MAHHPYTEADREIARGIMAAAEDRAAARTEPPVAPVAPPARRLTNRRGAPPPAAGAETRAKPPISNTVIASLVGGLVLFVALFALANQFGGAHRRLTTDHRPPTTAGPAGAFAAPPTEAPAATEAPAQVGAYAEPGGKLLGPIDASAPISFRHSDFPQWGGVEWNGTIVWIQADHAPPTSLPDLARPTPAPTPIIVERRVEVPIEVTPVCDIETNPRYTVTIEVYDDERVPLGLVTGNGCESQAEAQANADAKADAMKKREATK